MNRKESSAPLVFLNGSVCEERNEHIRWLTFLYGSFWGRLIRFIFIRKWFNWLVGWYQNSERSRASIDPFIKNYAIDMNDFVIPAGGYQSFNAFFIRKLKQGVRVIDQAPRHVIAPADSRVLVIPRLDKGMRFTVKGCECSLVDLCADSSLACLYDYGTCMVYRLAPQDYHHVHSPLQGVPQRCRHVCGVYESVHPYVYQSGVQPLLKNERQIVLLDTALCDQVAIVFVGALCVGKIVTTYTPSVLCEKGDELGYFAFGGSTVVTLFKQGVVSIEPRLVESSHLGIETVVKMGQQVATINA